MLALGWGGVDIISPSQREASETLPELWWGRRTPHGVAGIKKEDPRSMKLGMYGIGLGLCTKKQRQHFLCCHQRLHCAITNSSSKHPHHRWPQRCSGRFLCLAVLKPNYGDLGSSVLNFTPDKQEGAKRSQHSPTCQPGSPHPRQSVFPTGSLCLRCWQG